MKARLKRLSPRRRRRRPTLRLTPYAWAKLLSLRDAGPTEVGGFGTSSEHDPLLVEDVRLVRQECDWASVMLDDDAVADDFDRQVDLGRRPDRFARVWVHTHPGGSAQPSGTDEETFARVFGRCEWAVMLIVARSGATYARLRFAIGGASLPLRVAIDWDAAFPASDHEAWLAEHAACVVPLEEPAVPDQAPEAWPTGLPELPFLGEDAGGASLL